MPHPARALPRSAEGLPIPFITDRTDGVPRWTAIDPALQLECQIRWQCQVCGGPLSADAFVVVDEDDDVVSDTAMHQRCLSLALELCPHLRDTTTTRTVQVRRIDLLADDMPLVLFPVPPAGQFGTYGDAIRTWTLTKQPPSQTTAHTTQSSRPLVPRCITFRTAGDDAL